MPFSQFSEALSLLRLYSLELSETIFTFVFAYNFTVFSIEHLMHLVRPAKPAPSFGQTPTFVVFLSTDIPTPQPTNPYGFQRNSRSRTYLSSRRSCRQYYCCH